ncbi:citrate/2-methylcitrate synthase [Oceanispirochaeta sp.]|jgi:citrate synthase|uniref:citrate/2-methylcitrate synthase n=1 Tax=Oceanispirochaeta sp. TaxID=2035350 RepID=UPI0026059543|nr:citrate/2-methylcitrate synthase [Oceanispirochaeta sp.]MDA3957898.1 hypothetical protein [Oceanispirochaeta sp.]
MIHDSQKEKDPFHWQTAISYKTKDRIVVRGYDINELTGNLDFASMAWLTWMGKLASENDTKMINAFLVSLSEHAFSPSSVSSRFVRSGGVPLNVAVAGGVMTMGERHASADIPANMFQKAVIEARSEGISIPEKALSLVKEYRSQKRIINGYHHPQHIKDPRVDRLLEIAEELGLEGDHLSMALEIQGATKEVIGKTLYLNGPGVIAAIASDMDMTPEQIKGLLILSRTVSLVAHSTEENQREKAWRASSGSDIIQPLDLSLQKPEYYDGPEDRKLEE